MTRVERLTTFPLTHSGINPYGLEAGATAAAAAAVVAAVSIDFPLLHHLRAANPADPMAMSVEMITIN
jgi:hypothetical protein